MANGRVVAPFIDSMNENSKIRPLSILNLLKYNRKSLLLEITGKILRLG